MVLKESQSQKLSNQLIKTEQNSLNEKKLKLFLIFEP